jgi:hypothetical protein
MSEHSAALVSLIPFRALLSVAKALGGVGADPHRLPGGKQGLADALIRRYGADAILAQWQVEKSAPAPQTTPQGQGDGDSAPPEPQDMQGQGDAPDSDARDGKEQGDARTGGDDDGKEHGEAESQGQGEEKGEDTDGRGQGEEKGEEKGEESQCEECPAPDAPAPAPEQENPMSAEMRRIAKEESARAVLPVTTWLNGTLLPYVATRSAPQHGDAPMPDSSPGKGAPSPQPRDSHKGDAVQHRLMPKLLALVRAGATPLLVGPAGTGKSHAAKSCAEKLGRTYGSASLSAGVSESALMGWLLPVGESGRFDYVPAPFVTLYEQGNSVFLFDEMDAASPDMLVITNGATANGGFTVPQRFACPFVKRGVHQSIIGAANTIDGADDSYSARIQMDAATLNRMYTIAWGHDPILERSIAGLPVTQRYWTPKGVTEWTDAQWVRATEVALEWVESVRKVIGTHKLARVFSVRQTVMYQQALAAGCTHREIRDDLLMAWSPDEIAKLASRDQPKNAPVAGAESEGV